MLVNVIFWFWAGTYILHVYRSRVLSIFAIQGFRSRSPLSSPLADWAGFCNSRGSPSSGFHKPSLHRWHPFWPIWVLFVFMFTFSTAYTWCFRDRLLAAIWLDVASSSCIQSSSICQGWRERGPWAKPLDSDDGFWVTSQKTLAI